MTGSDTIAAVSTALGEGGIGIVRVSGDKAAEILGKIFAASGEKRPGGTDFADKTMYYGHILEPSSGETIDEALVVFMKGPKSYTGEDVCEIQCHGGGIPLRRILDIVCGLGAVPAQPGEFTKRAFLNGRIDLAQAGAVIDLIRSKTELGYHAAKEQSEGRLSERVRGVIELLLEALAAIAAGIDYPEYEAEEKELENGLALASSQLAELLEDAETGRIVRDGIRAVIIGKPNTGKSSLFNALAGEDAAIVTGTPGTTRDAIEVWIDVAGAPVLLTDTAGIREEENDIEKLGIERAKERQDKAEASIFLLDGSEPLADEDFLAAKLLDPEKKLIVAINKGDLPAKIEREKVINLLPVGFDKKDILEISLIDDERSREAVKIIENRLGVLILGGLGKGSSLLVTKARHKGLLEKARAEIDEAGRALKRGEAPEFAEVSLRSAWNALGEVTGETATEDIIDRVFEEFCVGK